MLEFLTKLFSSEQFIPHGHCYLWQPDLVWLHVVSDLAIALAYYSIPAMLVYFIRKRPDVPFQGIFILFGLFIISCGTTHVMEVWTLWHPAYWLSGSTKAFTAVVSLFTASEMISLIPKALSLPSPAQLEATNQELISQISERQRIEETLHQEREFLNAVLENVADGIVACDSEGILVLFNRAAREFHGSTAAPLPPDEWAARYGLYLADGETPMQKEDIPLFQAFQEQPIHNIEMVIAPQQSPVKRTLLASGQPIFDAQGKKLGAVVIMHDISDHKRSEKALEDYTIQLQQAVKFDSTLKRITDKVRDSLDESQILQTAVQELALGLGVSYCSAVLYNLDQASATVCYSYPTSMSSLQDQVLQLANDSEIYQQLLQGHRFEFCSSFSTVEWGWVSVLGYPIFLDQRSSKTGLAAETPVDETSFAVDQQVLGVLWLFNHFDYSFSDLEIRLVQQTVNQCAIAVRQARLYQAAQAQVQELEKLNRLKDDFLSTVSHELRTPVSNMKMATRMLDVALNQEEALCSGVVKPSSEGSKAGRYLQILQDECEREISLINDLLDLQRLAAGAQSLEMETTRLQDWLPQIVQPFQERARSRQQTLRVDLEADLPPLVSDLYSLERILAELLNNACKYTPPGEQITVTAHAQVGIIHLVVSNSGVEIPLKELDRIFEKFYRIPSHDPWKQSGTGLGLALVKKLTEHLGGEIRVSSQLDRTTFIVELPVQPAVEAKVELI